MPRRERCKGTFIKSKDLKDWMVPFEYTGGFTKGAKTKLDRLIISLFPFLILSLSIMFWKLTHKRPWTQNNLRQTLILRFLILSFCSQPKRSIKRKKRRERKEKSYICSSFSYSDSLNTVSMNLFKYKKKAKQLQGEMKIQRLIVMLLAPTSKCLLSDAAVGVNVLSIRSSKCTEASKPLTQYHYTWYVYEDHAGPFREINKHYNDKQWNCLTWNIFTNSIREFSLFAITF